MSYKNKWSSRNVGTTTASGISKPRNSSVETPSYATSWNSIRWGKSLVDHGKSAKLASAFESTSKTLYPSYKISSASPRFIPSPLSSKRKLPDISNLGPSVAERRSLFGEEKFKSFKPLATTTSIRPRTNQTSFIPSSNLRAAALMNTYYPYDSARKFSAASTSKTVNETGRKPSERIGSWNTPSVTRATESYNRRPIQMYRNVGTTTAPQSKTMKTTTEHPSFSITPKAERPWRQRLSDAAHLRSLHGDQVGTAISASISAQRSRKSSITNSNGNNSSNNDGLQTSLNALKQIVGSSMTSGNSRYRQSARHLSVENPRTYLDTPPYQATLSKYPSFTKYGNYLKESTKNRPYMSRSYSPVSSRRTFNPFTNPYSTISRETTGFKFEKQSSKESMYDNSLSVLMLTQTGTTETVPEGSLSPKYAIQKDSKKTRRKSKQQNLANKKYSDSSSGAEDRAESREKRLQKKRSKKKSLKDDGVVDADGKSSFHAGKSSSKQKRSICEYSNSDDTKNESASSAASSLSAIDAVAEDKSAATKNRCKKRRTIAEATVGETAAAALKQSSTSKKADEDATTTNAAPPDVDAEVTINLKPSPKPRLLNKPDPLPRANVPEVVPESDNDEFHSVTEGEDMDIVEKIVETSPKKEDAVLPAEVIDIPVTHDNQQKETAESKEIAPEPPEPVEVSPIPPTKKPKPPERSSKKRLKKNKSVDNPDTKKQSQNEHEKLSAKKTSTTVKNKATEAPVPGTWIGPTQEINISHNKRLERDQSLSLENVTAIKPIQDVSHAEPVKILLEKKKKEFMETFADHKFQLQCVQKAVLINYPIKQSVAVSKVVILKRRKPAVTSVKCTLHKSCKNAKISSTIVAKSKINEKCSLKVQKPSNVKVTIRQSLVCKRVKSKGQMTSNTEIVQPTATYGRNYYRCKRKVRACPDKRQSMPSLSALIDQQTAIIETEKNRLAQAAININSNDEEPDKLSKRKSESVASVVLDYLRRCDVVPLRRRSAICEDLLRDKQLLLGNRSLLEEYVNRRNRPQLERLHSEPPFAEDEETRGDSPCLSTASELIPACAVRILEPTRKHSYITVPSRSRLSSVEGGTHPSPFDSSASTLPNSSNKFSPSVAAENSGSTNKTNMLYRLAQAENLLTSSCRGFSTPFVHSKQQSLPSIRPTFKFDSPNSPFEAKMQHQAKLLRNSSVSSDISTLSECNSICQGTPTFDTPMQLTVNGRHRRSADGGTPITCNFEAAAAAASKPRHERYAAHIPLKRDNDEFCKTSSEIRDGTLKESNETMIDQTRFWRNQQRSKFKDAIDYLDQIFEDLKKECDPPQTKPKPLRRIQTSIVPNKSDPSSKLSSQQHTSQNRRNQVPDYKNRYSNPLFDTHSQQQSNSHPISQSEVAPRDKTAKVKSVKNPERSKVVSLSEKYNNGDVDVSETIVLPVARKKLKGDRLDFTQKWLEGDLKSWVAAAPKASFDGGYNGEDSFDERSLGSCSAEVAAINSVAKKKKRNRDNANNDKVVEPLKPNRKAKFSNDDKEQPTIIKPQVVRPQPVYGFPTGSNFVPVNASFGDGSSTTANSNFNSFPQPYWDHEMRIADMEHSDHSDYALKRVSSHNQVFDRRSKDMSRRANQDSYNSLGSVKSEDLAFGRPNGAFVQYSPNFSGKKSSAYLNHGSSSAVRMRMNSEQDPILTIDALVAELELNTDQDALNMKRRSFPTKFEPSFSGDVKQPKSKRQLSNVTSKTDVASKGRRKPKGSSFDEMATMLHNVANEVSSLENRSRKAPMSNYGGSVLSPFETINQERLEPSKVEAIQSMFESKANSSSTQHNPQRLPNPDKCDDTYYELGICNKIAKQPSPSHSKLATKSNSPSNASVRSQKIHKNSLSSHREFTPILSSTSQVPVCQTGSANSSQTGGYFSSGSSLGTSSFHTSQRQPSVPRKLGRQPSLVGAQSLSSQAVSVEDEDDGFYDNIQSDDKKIDCVEADEVSTTSRLPPTAKGTARITQFLKKIGGSKPPGSASSLMSLNKMLLDKTAANLGSITKSSSFSNEPWKEQVIGNNANVKNVSKKTRLGQILKNSLFGSKKKLNDT